MRAPVSVVIPTLDAAHRIGPCLAALAEGLGEGLVRELVIADGGSTDAIGAVAQAAGARLVPAPRGRGSQLAAGAAAAGGPWLLFLHADSVPGTGWPAAVRRHMSRHPGRAGYFDLVFDAEGLWPRLFAGWANLRARSFGLPWGDQGLLIPRALYAAAGGYPPVPLMEDVALSRALAGRLVPLGCAIVTSAERYRREGWVRRGLRNQGLLLRYALGVPPERLAARYRAGGDG
jgi:hypothetical protein